MRTALIYYECIIKPLENECLNLSQKLKSRKLSDLLRKSIYKERLTMYENLLREIYSRLPEALEEENRFNNEFVDLTDRIKLKLSL